MINTNYFVSNGKYPTFVDLDPTITVILMAKFNKILQEFTRSQKILQD